MNLLKVIHKEECLVNSGNLENVFQRILRTDSARGCIFKASGGTNFENFRLDANHVGTLRVQCIYRSAQKNSGYVTDDISKT